MQPLRPLDFSDDDDAPEVRERPDLLDKIQARLLQLSNDELRLVADGLPDYVEVMQSAADLSQLVRDNVADIKQCQASPNLRAALITEMDGFEFSVGRLLRKQMGIGVDVATWLSGLKSLPSTRIAKVDHTASRYTSHVNRNGDVYAGWGNNDLSGIIPPMGVVTDGPVSGTIGGQARGPRVVVGSMHQPTPGLQYMAAINPGLVGYAAYSEPVQGNVPADIATGTGAIAAASSRMSEILLNAQQIAALESSAPIVFDVDAAPAPVTFEESDVGPWVDLIDLSDEDDYD